MAQITREKLHQSLSRGNLSSVYLFYGKETYLIEEALAQIKNRVLEGGLPEFNLDVFYGQDIPMARITDSIEQLPMMANHRMVVLKELQDIKDKELQKLYSCLEIKQQTSVVVLISSQIDKRKKFYKNILSLSHLTSVEFRPPYDNEIPRWVSIIAKKYKLRLSQEGCQFMHHLIGSNLNEIETQIMKLSQYLGDKEKVSKEDILSVVSRTKIHSIFELTNAVGKNESFRAFACLENLIKNGQSEVGILILIARHIRILSAVKQKHSSEQKHLSERQLSTQLGVSPYFLKDYITQSRQWSFAKLKKSVTFLAQADAKLKSSSVPSRIYLQDLILKLAK